MRFLRVSPPATDHTDFPNATLLVPVHIEGPSFRITDDMTLSRIPDEKINA